MHLRVDSQGLQCRGCGLAQPIERSADIWSPQWVVIIENHIEPHEIVPADKYRAAPAPATGEFDARCGDRCSVEGVVTLRASEHKGLPCPEDGNPQGAPAPLEGTVVEGVGILVDELGREPCCGHEPSVGRWTESRERNGLHSAISQNAWVVLPPRATSS